MLLMFFNMVTGFGYDYMMHGILLGVTKLFMEAVAEQIVNMFNLYQHVPRLIAAVFNIYIYLHPTKHMGVGLKLSCWF